MGTFVAKFVGFFIPLILFLGLSLFLPVTPKASSSLLMAIREKEISLKSVDSPRIVLVGGSNLSFGICSQLIQDSLHLHPINMGIHASIGLIHMMNQASQNIKKGDLVVLIPEYQQYFGSYAYGSDGEELIRSVFDAQPTDYKLLGFKQWLFVLKSLPKYSLSKYNYKEYFNVEKSVIYGAQSFNSFGEVDKHWGMSREHFSPFLTIEDPLNVNVFLAIRSFKDQIEAKGGRLVLSFPCYQDSSFNNSKKQIDLVAQRLQQDSFVVVGSPARYTMPDSLLFNTPYHLTKNGMEYRTKLLVQDINLLLSNS